jgi:hypothetical protein
VVPVDEETEVDEEPEPIPTFSPAFQRTMAIVGGAQALVLSLTVLLQWAVWLLLTSQILSPYGMALGIAVAASQIVMFFSSPFVSFSVRFFWNRYDPAETSET